VGGVSRARAVTLTAAAKYQGRVNTVSVVGLSGALLRARSKKRTWRSTPEQHSVTPYKDRRYLIEYAELLDIVVLAAFHQP
jgi:hypothetical protein